ncbi:pyridoxal phosphate-dependent aminotransferase [Runella salmonicolor]|uniref:Aminotransferase class I/II-fold pyridoxal phosphate-dependent enzyme n=1 Tax=Runella salmonicolor TaxID=2950278 RepID=A0ABT1FSC2_9BACT|nr:histidinol-phosphate transaminase [Runella salmonicolor]MCP1384661.1 aminotransferase class I/II-fold pyridoxal phosphate-dependent enzyme [Runella salmonicolor]
MSSNLNRRDWLKSGLLASAGLTIGQANPVNAAPVFTQGILNVYAERELELAHEAMLAAAPQIKARLSSNENPWGPSTAAIKAISDTAPKSFLYAGPVTMELRKAIAEMNGVSPDQVLLGAGSSELLMASLLMAGAKGKVMMAETCYISGRDAREDGATMPTIKVPLTKDYQYDLDAMDTRLSADTSLVYICNPNNPTGVMLPSAKLSSFCDTASPKSTVLVDEAYIDYAPNPATDSMVEHVRKGQNVLILRTLSKLHGFAGLRIGYALGQPATLKELRKYCSGGFTVSTTSAAAAIASFKDKAFQEMVLKNTAESKKFLYDTLKSMDYTYLPSSANFVLFPIKVKGQVLLQKMMAEGVSVRSWFFDQQNWCRVSIGTMDEMKAFKEAFAKSVS